MPGSGDTGIDTLGKLWDRFHKNKPLIQELKTDGDELGVAYSGANEGYYCYFAGAEAEINKPSEGYTSWELPEGEYIICSFEAEDFEHLIMDAVYKAHKYLFETCLPNHKLTVKPFAAERYARHSPETTCMEVWVFPEIDE